MLRIRPAIVVTGLASESCVGTNESVRDRNGVEWDIVRCTDGFRAQHDSQRSPLLKSADEARRWALGPEAHVGLSDGVVFAVAIGVIGLALVYGLVMKVVG